MESRMEALPDRNRGVAFDRFPPVSEPTHPRIKFVSATEMIATPEQKQAAEDRRLTS
jgi:hypothetical protein